MTDRARPGLVALYDIRPGNGAGPFLQPRSPHGAVRVQCNKKISEDRDDCSVGRLSAYQKIIYSSRNRICPVRVRKFSSTSPWIQNKIPRICVHKRKF